MPHLTLYLCRHGDTAWSAERRLAGRTDIPLVQQGERNAHQLGERLQGVVFERVLASPLGRARRTAELAGYGGRAELDPRLLEMNFGRFEGLTVEEIRRDHPGWTYLRDGCPGGEQAADVGARVDALLGELSASRGSVALFAHSVVLRVLAARFLGLGPEHGRQLMLSPGAVCVLGYDEVDDSRAIASWNDRAHLVGQHGFA
jgi:probable phosphoglycerate mutase